MIVAGILGDPEPVEIARDQQGRSVLEPSCTYGSQFAYPAVRTASFLSQLPQSLRETICEDDLSRALVEIGALLKWSGGDPCFEGELADLDPTTDGLQAECVVSDYRELPDGTTQEVTPIPACDGSATLPCWRIEHDPNACHYTDTMQKLVIDRGGEVPPSDMFVKVDCVTRNESGPFQ